MIDDIVQFIYGLSQKSQAKKGLAGLERPVYEPDENILYNQKLAQANASQGYGDQYLNFGADAIDRNFGTSVNSFEKTGQGLNTIVGAQTASNNAFQQLLMADSMEKQRNQQYLYDANKDVADQNLMAFQYNEADPYTHAFNQYTQQSNSGIQNIFSGIGGIEDSTAQLIGLLTGGVGGLGGAKSGSGNSGSSNFASNYGNQSGFQNYSSVPNLDLSQFNYLYGL